MTPEGRPTLPVSTNVEPTSPASTRDNETITARTLRGLSRVLDRVEVHVTLMASLLHVFEELMDGKGMVRTSIDGAREPCVEQLMLVANVLSQVIFPKEGLLTMFGTARDECVLVFGCTSYINRNRDGDIDSACSE
jgi:hypothetical protein